MIFDIQAHVPKGDFYLLPTPEKRFEEAQRVQSVAAVRQLI
jgi:hypothetical protein